MTADSRFEIAIQRIDEANAEDPNTETVNGDTAPKSLIYGQRMSRWIDWLAPGASEALQLAARAQHIRRWEIPRDEYPMTRAGYHQWRTRLYSFHAEKAGEILRDVGYDKDTIDRVGELLQKKNLRTDQEAGTLEDAAALVFLENDFQDFAEREDIDEAKMVRILQKTWRKMTDRGHEAAFGLHMPPRCKKLVEKALQ